MRRHSNKKEQPRIVKLSEGTTISLSFYNSDVYELRLEPIDDIVAEPGATLRFRVVGVKLNPGWITE